MPGGIASQSSPTPTAPVATAAPAAVAIPRTEPLAIWSLVLSLVGLFCCGFFIGIPGIICGHLALSKFAKDSSLQGRGLAVAGLVIGYVAVAFWLLYLIFFGGASFLEGLTRGTTR